MMECERCNERLSAYADGRLSAREAGRVRAHVAACRRCHEDLAELKELQTLLRALPDPTPSPAFWSDTHRRIRRHAAAQRRSAWRQLRLHPAWGATAVALLLVLLAVFPLQQDHAPAPLPIVNPAALISMHAMAHAARPLADSGALRFACTEANAQDLADDSQLDAD